MHRPALTACLGMAAALALQAQQTPPRPSAAFVSEVELVVADVSVLDKKRAPVRGLTASDFTILEDGKRRTVVTFAAVELPEPLSGAAPWVRTVAPDVVSNTVPDEGRVVVILMDDSITWVQQADARAIGQAIVAQMGPTDVGAVVYSSAFSSTPSPQNFTTDRARLLAAVNHPFFGMTPGPEIDATPSGADECHTRALETIAHVAESLAEIPQRRKSVFLIARTLSFMALGPCGLRLKTARERAFRAVDVANVTVHAIDPSGLEYVEPQLRAALLQRQDNLAVLPDRTGGRLVANTNGQGQLVPTIFDESRSYYLLGFERANAANDGEFHSIDVKVRRRDVSVHARRGYYARPAHMPAVPASDELLSAAVSRQLPSDDIALRAIATPVAEMGGQTGAVAVVVAVDPDPTGVSSNQFDVSVTAFDARGTSVGSIRQQVELVGSKGEPSEILSRLSLKPGMYEIRAAVRDRAKNRTGSVYTYVDVPNFLKSELSLSGVLFAAQPAWAAGPSALFSDLPIVPTTQRTFRRTDRVTGFLSLHQTGTPKSIAVTLHITDEQGRALITDASAIDGRDMAGSPATADYRFRLPVANLASGGYLLTIEAAAGKQVQRRDIKFTVR